MPSLHFLVNSILAGVSIGVMTSMLTSMVIAKTNLLVSSHSLRLEEWSKNLFIFRPQIEYRRVAIAIILGSSASPVIVLVLTGKWVLAVGVGLLIWWAPMMIYRLALERRMDRFDEQLPDAVDSMIASARAGRSLQQAIQDVSDRMPAPVAQEFNVIATEYHRGGLGLEEALSRARDRIKVESFTMVSTALIISLSQGGDLLNILVRISEALRELIRLKKRLHTETTEVRTQEKVIMIMTPLFAGLICMFDKEIPHILFDTIVGNILLAIVAGIQIISILWVRRIVRSAV